MPFPIMHSIHLDGAANIVSLERVLLGLVLRSWDLRASDCVELAHHGVVDGAAGEALAVGVGHKCAHLVCCKEAGIMRKPAAAIVKIPWL